MMKGKEFKAVNSKLLLFGEYTVINGGRSLALPIQNFQGRLKINETPSENNLEEYLGFLLHNDFFFNDKIPDQNIWNHIVFDSNIPVGYGAGSSGAITAAIYEAFLLKKNKELEELQKTLARMENYFHGQSSGLDPLVIALNTPVLVSSEGVEPIEDMQKIKQSLQHFYLIDTGISRSTGPLVNVYKSKLNDTDFITSGVSPLLEANENAINSVLDNQIPELRYAVNQISEIQFNFFKEMIPGSYMDLWEELLDTEDMRLKLCGAGGGGFLLFFCEDPQEGMSFLDRKEIDFLDIQF